MTEKEFEKMVREHRGTIYTVCYMFAQDNEEVADLFQEILINLWKGSGTFRGESSQGNRTLQKKLRQLALDRNSSAYPLARRSYWTHPSPQHPQQIRRNPRPDQGPYFRRLIVKKG